MTDEELKAVAERVAYWATLALMDAEERFLGAHGWTIVGDDLWLPPPGLFDDERATRPRRGGHAVNTQKFFTFRRR